MALFHNFIFLTIEFYIDNSFINRYILFHLNTQSNISKTISHYHSCSLYLPSSASTSSAIYVFSAFYNKSRIISIQPPMAAKALAAMIRPIAAPIKGSRIIWYDLFPILPCFWISLRHLPSLKATIFYKCGVVGRPN